MSVPRIDVSAVGAARRQTAASVYASAPYEQPALQARRVPSAASAGMHVLAQALPLLGVAPQVGDVDRHAVEELVARGGVAGEQRR